MSGLTGAQTFDPFESIDPEDRHLPASVPFWTQPLDDEKELLKWLNNTYDILKTHATARVERQRRNLAAYKGIHYQAQDIRTREVITRANVPVSRTPRAIANHAFDLIEQHVSRLTKFRPAVSVLPKHNEHRDKIAAKISEDIIEAIWDKNEIDYMFQKMARIKRILGEVYLLIEWDPNLGDLHPDYKEELERAKKNGKKDVRTPLVGKDGERILGTNGEPLFIDKPVRVGDVKYKIKMPWDILLQRVDDYCDVEWGFSVEIEDVDNLKGDYPDKSDEIKENKGGEFYDVERLTTQQMKNQVEKITFYHKRTHRLDGGRKIVFTRDAILKNEELPFDHGKLPWVRQTDIDVPGHLNAMPTFDLIRPLQTQHNNLVSMILRNQSMVAHPKWFVPRGSVKKESLGNDVTIVQFQGPIRPELASPPVTPSEIFNFADKIEQWMGQIGGVHQVSRGVPPSGIKAGVALQFLDEQESERSNSLVAKHNMSIKEIATMTAQVAGQYYDDDDDRLENLLGPDKATFIKDFKMADLANFYDIVLQTSSALPQNRAARVQTVLDLHETFPGRFSDDQVLDMLDFAQDSKFIDKTTIAIRAAEKENDEILRTGKTSAPEFFEDQLAHYKIHARALNEPSFRSAPKKNFESLVDHVRAHEMLILKVARKNPAILEEVLAIVPQFPIFFVETNEQAALSEDEMAMQEELAALQGQAGGAMAPEEPMPNPIDEGSLAIPDQEILAGSENITPTPEGSLASEDLL